jgi:diguanylate cyclase (GGDEF)-like protein
MRQHEGVCLQPLGIALLSCGQLRELDHAPLEARDIPAEPRHSHRTRLLIIEPDDFNVAQLASVFDRSCWKSHGQAVQPRSAKRRDGEALHCACGEIHADAACCIAIGSLAQLHRLDVTHRDVVICATDLADGSGLDALAYIRGTAPESPVILIGADSSIAVEAIRGGALDFVVTDETHDLLKLPLVVEKCLVHQRIKQENERLHRDLKASLSELAVTNHQLQSVIRQLEAMARTDELTGLSNRRWLNLMLQGHWAESLRHGLPLACLMIDMDGFKSVNDLRGHAHGDDLLKTAAKVIRANCRQVDVPARYGGDEFCVLMGHTEPAEALMVAHRILREFDYAMRTRPADDPRVSMSIGVAHITISQPANAEQLITHADEAMYAAKAAGKQRVMLRQTDGRCVPATS